MTQVEQDVQVLMFEKLHPDVTLPSYANPTDSGLDICYYSHTDRDRRIWLFSDQTIDFTTGLRVAIPSGFEIQVRGRSSLGMKGVGVTQGIGTIDEGYRGEIKIILTNNGGEAVNIKHGDKIAQLVLAPVTRAEVIECEVSKTTTRGEKGFGSSGR